MAAGLIGGAPTTNLIDVQLPVNAKGRLSTPEEFGNIIVRAGKQGELILLKDLARIEMSVADFNLAAQLDGQPAVAIPIFQSPGANAIQISDGVRAKMAGD